MSFRHLRSGPSTVSCVPLRGTCLRRTPTHYIRPWVDGSLAVCVSRSGPWRPFCLSVLCISKILRQAVITLQQIHFGNQCATERVHQYLPAKVKLKKSHFGKPPLTECALCSPPCQSELAELREPKQNAQSRTRPCAILQISVYKRRLVGTDNKLSKHCSVRIINDELRDATAFT